MGVLPAATYIHSDYTTRGWGNMVTRWGVCEPDLGCVRCPPLCPRSTREATVTLQVPKGQVPGCIYVCLDKNLEMFGCSPSPSVYTYPNKWLHVTLGKDWETLLCSCYDAVGFFLLGAQPLLWPLSSGPENCQGTVPFCWDSCPQPLDQPS